MGILFIFPLLIVILAVLASCIRIVPQAQALVVERLGAYLDTWSVGVHFLVPFVDRVAKKVSLKEQVVDFDPHAPLAEEMRGKETRERERDNKNRNGKQRGDYDVLGSRKQERFVNLEKNGASILLMVQFPILHKNARFQTHRYR